MTGILQPRRDSDQYIQVLADTGKTSTGANIVNLLLTVAKFLGPK